MIYDRFICNGDEKLLIDTGNFGNPSAELGAQITGGNIFANGIYAGIFGIYAPNAWSSGSSMVHVAEIYNGTENALMTYSISKGEAIHWPGPIIRNFYKDIGWIVIPEPETAWGAGSNALGQLGISSGSLENQPTPVFIEGVTNVIDISAGAYHTAAIKDDGSLWAWGKNEYGQIGDGTTTQRLQPVQIASLSDMIFVSCGNSHTLGLKKDGTVYAWGYNFFGQLGDGTSDDSHQPVQVPGLERIVQVSAGDYHSLALCSDGTVYDWGWNGLQQIDPAKGEYILSPVVVPGLSGIRKISAGGEHSIALDKNRNVWTWGWNWYGQIGDGTTSSGSGAYKTSMTGAIGVAAGIGHSVALKDDGTVWTWGLNDFGQLGNGNNINSSVPSAVPGLAGIADIASGSWHTIAVNVDRGSYVWGRNSDGDLGIGETGNSKSSPVKIESTSKFYLVDGGYHYLVFLSESQDTVRVKVSAFPENGGTTNPSGNLLGDKSTPLDVTAVAADNWTFVNWTAEPPANATFADSSSPATEATLSGDATITANFQENPPAEAMAYGRKYTIGIASIPGIIDFTGKPKVYATYTPDFADLKFKKTALNVFTEISEGGAVNSIDCEWTGRMALLHKNVWTDKTKTTKQILEENPPEPLVCRAFASATDSKNTKVKDVNTGIDLSLLPPVITDVIDESGNSINTISTATAGQKIRIVGRMFGKAIPVVWMEYPVYQRDGTTLNGINRFKLKVDKSSLKFEDAKKKPSVMDIGTGDSEMTVIIPDRWPRGWKPGAHNIVIDNKVCRGTIDFNTQE